MTHKIIAIPNRYLLIVDKEKVIEPYKYYLSSEMVLLNTVKPVAVRGNPIMTHLPLNNSPILEGVDLLPEIPNNDIKELAKKAQYQYTWGDNIKPFDLGHGIVDAMSRGFGIGWEEGYKAASQTKKYSEEDIDKAYKEGYHLCAYNHRKELRGTDLEMSIMLEQEPMDKKEFIKSLSTLKIPIGFKPEMRTDWNEFTKKHMVSLGDDPKDFPFTPKPIIKNGVWQGEYVFENLII